MDSTSDSTPSRSNSLNNNARRSLGLRRSITKKQIGNKTPISNTKKKDAVIQYLKEESQQCQSPKTPVNELKLLNFNTGSTKINDNKIVASSSKSSSYKLSLSKKFRDQNSKKKLSFSPVTLSNIKTFESSPCSSKNVNIEESSIASTSSIENSFIKENLEPLDFDLINEIELKDEYETMLKQINDIKKRENKINELKSSIKTWENGFRRSFAELKTHLQTNNNEMILNQYNLPLDLLQLL